MHEGRSADRLVYRSLVCGDDLGDLVSKAIACLNGDFRAEPNDRSPCELCGSDVWVLIQYSDHLEEETDQ